MTLRQAQGDEFSPHSLNPSPRGEGRPNVIPSALSYVIPNVCEESRFTVILTAGKDPELRSPLTLSLVAIRFFADEQFVESQTCMAQNDGYFALRARDARNTVWNDT